MTDIQGFEVLTRVYLGQDWHLFGETIDDAVAEFIDDGSPEDVASSIAGLENLIAADLSDSDYYDRWVFDLHGAYDPRAGGRTYREFFQHVLALLRAAASQSR